MDLKIDDQLGFSTTVDRLRQSEPASFDTNKMIPFGVKFLDDTLFGISPTDLVVIGAKTGVGKTELATHIALTNAKRGLRVRYFALEAHKNEIEMRMMYKLLLKRYLKANEGKTLLPSMTPRYHLWVHGLAEYLNDYWDDAYSEFELGKNIKTFYRENKFDLDDFQRISLAIKDDVDLFIVDHLHYFDLSGPNENQALTETIKGIRDLGLHVGAPIILLAQFRKSDRKFQELMPSAEDFHGTSNIPKIATKIITFSKGDQDSEYSKTYVRAAKVRTGSELSSYVGIMKYSFMTNSYEEGYRMARYNEAKDEVDAITDPKDLPPWLQG